MEVQVLVLSCALCYCNLLQYSNFQVAKIAILMTVKFY